MALHPGKGTARNPLNLNEQNQKNKAVCGSDKLIKLLPLSDYKSVKKISDKILAWMRRSGKEWMADKMSAEDLNSHFGITDEHIRLLTELGCLESYSIESSADRVWALDELDRLFLGVTMEHWIENNLRN